MKPAAGSAKPEPVDSKIEIDPKGSAAPTPPPKVEHRGPVKPSPEIAAIKFELLPNWDRDLDEAGTISLNVKVPRTGATTTFVFHYGYEDPSAPTDRDQYKKWLHDQHLLDVTTDRQRGTAWYLENNNQFRFLINYGGKRLICYGSQYRDPAHDPMGDLRDEVILQAKKICETLSL